MKNAVAAVIDSGVEALNVPESVNVTIESHPLLTNLNLSRRSTAPKAIVS
jgi:hypothetical protein